MVAVHFRDIDDQSSRPTEGKIGMGLLHGERNRAIGIELRTLALDLNDIKRAIENRRGDHETPESTD
jgi:hypothetical protein